MPGPDHSTLMLAARITFLGLGFATFLRPQPMQGRFVRTHDYPGV